MDNLSKSLAALDAAAEEMLKKSKNTDDIKPNDVSDSGDNDEDTVEKCDTPDGDNAVKKSDGCDGDDCDDVQKSDDVDEDDDTVQKSDDTDDDEDGDDDESLEDVQKSIEDDFQSDVDILKGIENSEFQAAMIATLVKSLGEIQYDINQNKRAASTTSAVLAKSLQAALATNQKLMADNEKLVRRVNKLEKSLSQGFEKVMDAIDGISVEPAHVRKSVSTINVHDRNFQKSLGSDSVGGFENLSKSQIVNVLTNELYAGNQLVSPADIISVESGAPLRQELRDLVANKCK